MEDGKVKKKPAHLHIGDVPLCRYQVHPGGIMGNGMVPMGGLGGFESRKMARMVRNVQIKNRH